MCWVSISTTAGGENFGPLDCTICTICTIAQLHTLRKENFLSKPKCYDLLYWFKNTWSCLQLSLQTVQNSKRCLARVSCWLLFMICQLGCLASPQFPPIPVHLFSKLKLYYTSLTSFGYWQLAVLQPPLYWLVI